MNYLKKEIKNICESLNLTVGFTEIEYFKDLEDILIKQEKSGYKTTFQVGNIDDKVFKNESIYTSAIVVIYPYDKLCITPKDNEVYFSSCAIGNDYHIVLKEKLEKIEKHLTKKGYKVHINVDNNILEERYLAYKAGLGYYGKNGLLINDTYGSLFFIGVILTDAIFEYDTHLNKNCLNCNKCIEICPTQAINETGILNGKRCLSYLTQKKEIEDADKKYFNACIYGCDKCINVCPHNSNLSVNNNFKQTGIELMNADKFLNLTEEEYKILYKNNSSFWRGKKVIDRNILIHKENNLKKNG